MSKNAFLLLKGDEGRFSVVIDNKSYILIQPPLCVLDQFEIGDNTRLVKNYQVGRAIIYIDDGQEKVIFETDIEDTIEKDGFDAEQIENLEMIDVIWFI